MDKPLVSIIINNFNYEKFLSQAIQSALEQTYANTEVIVVDDCSTDRSRQIIADYGDRIIPILHETNGKQGAAFNSGFSQSKGDIIIFLDSDDYLYPHAVEKIVEVWQPEISKVHYRLDVVDSTGGSRNYFLPPVSRPLATGDAAASVLSTGGYTSVPTSGNALNRKALSEVTPIAPEYNTTSDDYLHALIPFFGEVRAIEEPLGAYRIHETNQWALATITSSRFHRFIRHDLQRCELIQSWGSKLGRDVPDDLYMRDFGRVWSRLSSLRFDPKHHPVPSDRRANLMLLGVRALWLYSDYNPAKKTIFSLWFLWVGLTPGFLAKPAIVWLFAPHQRPKLVSKLLSRLKSLTSSNQALSKQSG